jgi:hypothetical protein
LNKIIPIEGRDYTSLIENVAREAIEIFTPLGFRDLNGDLIPLRLETRFTGRAGQSGNSDEFKDLGNKKRIEINLRNGFIIEIINQMIEKGTVETIHIDDDDDWLKGFGINNAFDITNGKFNYEHPFIIVISSITKLRREPPTKLMGRYSDDLSFVQKSLMDETLHDGTIFFNHGGLFPDEDHIISILVDDYEMHYRNGELIVERLGLEEIDNTIVRMGSRSGKSSVLLFKRKK